MFTVRFALACKLRERKTIALGITINIALPNNNSCVIRIPAISPDMSSSIFPGA